MPVVGYKLTLSYLEYEKLVLLLRDRLRDAEDWEKMAGERSGAEKARLRQKSLKSLIEEVMKAERIEK